ncbi:ArsR-family transcriptional regulator (repressor) [Blastococcus saxobsidens DD2]|uniref:ArsR-family transcriptional regulator (Repressor) n=2 Tax=Blastococcus saxobsidens TaxID=138336 RepID=H6RPZ5_BLASD|nr:ArsR-family transcriptional regulator (repressor) [Blastococcus saxobsidens DD2]
MNSSRTPAALTVLDQPTDAAACAPAPMTGGLNADAAAALAQTLKALADPARLRLLSLIAGSSTGEACVCDLTGPLGLSQPTVSHHCKVLVDAGLLTREKRGVWAYYALVRGALDNLAGVLSATGAPGGRTPAAAALA